MKESAESENGKHIINNNKKCTEISFQHIEYGREKDPNLSARVYH